MDMEGGAGMKIEADHRRSRRLGTDPTALRLRMMAQIDAPNPDRNRNTTDRYNLTTFL